MLIKGPAVQWKEGEAHMVGFLLYNQELEGEFIQVITAGEGLRLYVSLSSIHRVLVLVRIDKASHPTESVVEKFVPWQNLYHYYGDRQPDSLPLEHVSQPRLTNEYLAELKRAETVEAALTT